jgi:serpin B
MRQSVILVIIFIALLEMAGCAPQTEAPTDNTPISSTANNISTQINGNNVFAFTLYQKIKEASGNIFYSPYSISNTLAMTYAGAKGETAKQMAAVLHFNLPDNTLHSTLKTIQQDLVDRNNSKSSQISIANALWGQKGVNFLPEYLKQIKNNYGGAFKTLDFIKAAEPSRLEINKWISEKTRDRIPEMLKPGIIDDTTALVITNALYLKASWKSIFSYDTDEEAFYTPDGEKIMVPMMARPDWKFSYGKGDNYQAIDLPYKACDLSMLVVLPDAGQFTAFENSLDNIRLDSIIQTMEDTTVNLTMPEFKFETNYLLNPYLQALGMINAFGNADFSGMANLRDLFVSDVLHSTYISVDQYGTEAAAGGTSVMMLGSGKVTMEINRPFIFLIRDNQTGTILFIGRVLNPKSE